MRLLLANALFWLHLLSGNTHAADVSISWNKPCQSQAVAGYEVHYGPESGRYVRSVDAGNLTSCTIEGLDPLVTHYFAITAYDTSGQASDHSIELVWDNEAPQISGPDEIVIYQDGVASENDGTAAQPGIASLFGIHDDFSTRANITVQCVVAKYEINLGGEGHGILQIIAEDETGNSASTFVKARWEQDRRFDSVTHPQLRLAETEDSIYLEIQIPARTPTLTESTPHYLTLERCTNLNAAAWTAVPGYEHLQLSDLPIVVIYQHQLSSRGETGFFRLCEHSD